MIHLLYGDNEFEKRAALAALVGDADVVRYDGEELTLADMQEITIGQTLFTQSSVYVISKLSENSDIWSQLPDMQFDEDNTIILIESKLDKRTKTYKWLQKTAKTQEFLPLSDRQKPQLISWCEVQARERGYRLTHTQIGMLIDRLGFDQLRLSNFLDQLALAEEITDELIDQLVPLARSENVFDLFVAALSKDYETVHNIISYLESESGLDGAYQTMGLLASQATNMAALVLAGGDNKTVAADLSVNPYVLQRLSSSARTVDIEHLRRISDALFQADLQMKTTGVNPWLLIETALVSL
ncbi:MAG: hypothetical protein D8G53_16015 [Candidatus Saccharimonas sp.]|nr:MAG: hypothetical protein D8G53_16015 [Candidatus Saccharimonas sp.]